jgi:hypothetical protein
MVAVRPTGVKPGHRPLQRGAARGRPLASAGRGIGPRRHPLQITPDRGEILQLARREGAVHRADVLRSAQARDVGPRVPRQFRSLGHADQALGHRLPHGLQGNGSGNAPPPPLQRPEDPLQDRLAAAPGRLNNGFHKIRRDQGGHRWQPQTDGAGRALRTRQRPAAAAASGPIRSAFAAMMTPTGPPDTLG